MLSISHGQAVQRCQVGPENLDRQVAAHAGQHFRHAHVDRLREGKADAGEIGHHRAQLVGQPGRVGIAPGVARLQHHEGVGLVEAHRVEAEFVGAGAGDDGFHFRHLGQNDFLHAAVDGDGLVEADRRQLFQLHDQVAFVHGRHEALAEQQEGAGGGDQRDRGADHVGPAVAQGRGQHAVVGRGQLFHQPRFVMRAALDQVRGEHRHHGQRQQQRGGQREDDGQRHRSEHLAFQPLQGEQRQEDDDDDDDAGSHGRGHLAGCTVDQVQRRQVVLGLGELAFDVLDDDHGGIDQHADGDGQAAQAHQVGRQAEQAHQDEGGQGRQRQHQRDDQRGAQVAEEGEEQQHDEHDGFEQRLGHRADSAVDQVAAVVERFDGDALRQGRRDLGQPRLDAGHDALGVGAAQAEHQPLHRFALTISGHRTIAGQGAETDFCDIADAHHLAVPGLQNDGFYVVDRTDRPFGAHQQGFLAIVEAAGAVVAVVGFQHRLQILQRQAAGGQALRLRHDLEGAHLAAQAVDVGDAGDGAQLRADHPVEQGALLGQRQVALDGEHEHFAERRGDWRHAAGGAGRQVAHRRGQALADLLAGPVDVGAVLEIDGDVGQRVFRGRAQQALVRDAEHFLLDRHGEAGFDFLRRHAGRLQDDLDLGRRDIGKGVDRQAEESLDAGADEHDGQHQNQQALGQRKTDQGVEHYSLPTPARRAFRPETPLTATRSPACTPSTSTLSPPWLTTRTGRAAKRVPWSSLEPCTKA